MKLNNPAPGRPVTSPYGPRRHPITGELGKMHHGVDFGGTFDVICVADGIIDHVGYSATGGGHVVIIKHAPNLYSVYYHGRERTTWNKGDRIAAGAKVYVSGSTGASTGPHLHFELRKSRKWGDTQDPQAFIDREITVDTKPSVLKVDGKLGKHAWRKFQEVLKRDWGYEGIVDGKPGPMTYRAIQRSAGAKVDGIFDLETRKLVQKRLKGSDFYLGELDGIWGRGTITALQRALNQNHY